jgi:hypothetical protein
MDGFARRRFWSHPMPLPWNAWRRRSSVAISLLTGTYPPLVSTESADRPVLAVGGAAVAIAGRIGRAAALADLAEQDIRLVTVAERGRPIVLLAGGSPVAVQWAVYAFLEHLGCGFFLGGDALPPRQPDAPLPDLDVRARPVFAVRGTLPWYNFLNSPTVWNLDDYRRFFDQLAKQRANFVGFHSYDYEPWAAYRDAQGRFRAGLPLCTSGSSDHLWGAVPTPASEYAFGTNQLYARDLFGADCALDYPTPQEGIEQQQAMLATALAYARSRGIRPCLGFEVHGDPEVPDNQAALRQRISYLVQRYPLDYLWIWQAEGRGGAGILQPPRDVRVGAEESVAAAFRSLENPERIAEGVRISRYASQAHAILREVAPGVRLIVSGWGGDQWMRFTDFFEGLDQTLPGDVIFAALDNIDPTFEPNVSAVYGRLPPGRERWPILWFESDGGGTRRDQWGPQPNVNAFAPLLADALAKGCQGVLGIHWRTRAVEEVAAYTLQWAWEPELTPDRFFQRYSTACYGPARAMRLAEIHEELERLGPRWTGAMGQVECHPFTWFSTHGYQLPPEEAVPPYRAGRYPRPENLSALARIERDLVALLDQLPAAEARYAERLRYLLQTLRWVVRYDATAKILSAEGPVEAALRRAEELAAAGQRDAAREAGRRALELLWEAGFPRAVQTLAENVTNQGELGVLATVNGKAVAAYRALIRRIAAVLGEARESELLAPAGWPDRLAVQVLVTPDLVRPGEPIRLVARVMGPAPIVRVVARYRRLGAPMAEAWCEQTLAVVRRAVYATTLDVPEPGVCYAVEAQDAAGASASAPLGWPETWFSTTLWS